MNYTEQCYDIIVLAGQSNAQGTGRGEVPVEYIPDNDIISLSPEYTITRIIENEVSKRHIVYQDAPLRFEIATERIVNDQIHGDLSLTFSKKYKENGCLKPGRKVLIIRAAIGATGFAHGQWGSDAPLYLKLVEMLEYALSLNKENKLVALLWHQGEHEVNKDIHPEEYRVLLKKMFCDLIERFNAHDLPIISADFTNQWKNAKGEKAFAVSKVIENTVEELGGVFLETTDLLSNSQQNHDGDVVHFSRKSLYILGERFFEAYKTTQKN